MIDIENLTVRYVGRRQPAFQNLSLRFNAGETVLLLGASGCGKSTLALCLNGLIPHSVGVELDGQVRVEGLDTRHTPVAALAQKVGIVFQDPEAQFVTLKVEDEIVFGLENLRRPPETMSATVERALAEVGMTGARERAPHTLSGGEKQRIALAALLAMEPGLLVFDEPTANLDPVGTQAVFALLAELKARAQHTIVLIEHKLDDLLHLLDRVVVLGHQGAVVADGDPRTVFYQQPDELRAHGVWTPQVVQLVQALRAQGVALAAEPLTLAEAEAALRQTAFTPTPVAPPSLTPVAADAPPAVELRGLSFAYGRQTVLHDLHLSVPRGDFLAIVGGNGAGKTTLAQHLIDILSPRAGTVFIAGQDITRYAAHDLIRKVGFVFQNPEHQFITPTVAEEVRFGLRVMGLAPADIEARTTGMLERFGLARYAEANPFTLSHGEKRRLSVATMLAMGQDILILDEPTFGQDQRQAEALMCLLAELHAEGRTVIVITHDMALVAEYAHTVAVMSAGRLLFHGPTRAAFDDMELLAQARLTLPPLAQLSARLAAHEPAWAELLTVRDFVTAWEAGRTASAFPLPQPWSA